ncbi:AMP-binding protein, partial [Arthrospira platensis SPKY1]|nr:AMP-binding protein [Arthrospira platensis SPKY1]
GSVGFANFYIDTRVVDDKGRDLGPNEIGELWLRGPACMPGYWNLPEATAQTIENGWLKTGDLVRCDEDGYFFIVDRKKELYISGAENVYPAEIEHVLRTHPAILEVAVIGVPDAQWGEVGKAFVVRRPGLETNAEELADFCR